MLYMTYSKLVNSISKHSIMIEVLKHLPFDVFEVIWHNYNRKTDCRLNKGESHDTELRR